MDSKVIHLLQESTQTSKEKKSGQLEETGGKTPTSAEIEEMIREKVERIRSEYNEKIEELNVEIFE